MFSLGSAANFLWVLTCFIRLVCAPILLMQGRKVRQRTLRLPEAKGVRIGLETVPSCSQHPPLRLLVLGDSSAAGVGVDQQKQALAQPIACHLARLTGRNIHWQLWAQSGLDSVSALDKLQNEWQAQIQAADVVLVVLGVNDVSAQRRPTVFSQHYAALLQTLAQATGAKCLLANALPPMQKMQALPWPLRPYLGLYARTLDLALQQLCREKAKNPQTQAQTQYLGAPAALAQCSTAADGFHPGADAYRTWAEWAACRMAQALHYHPSPC